MAFTFCSVTAGGSCLMVVCITADVTCNSNWTGSNVGAMCFLFVTHVLKIAENLKLWCSVEWITVICVRS